MGRGAGPMVCVTWVSAGVRRFGGGDTHMRGRPVPKRRRWHPSFTPPFRSALSPPCSSGRARGRGWSQPWRFASPGTSEPSSEMRAGTHCPPRCRLGDEAARPGGDRCWPCSTKGAQGVFAHGVSFRAVGLGCQQQHSLSWDRSGQAMRAGTCGFLSEWANPGG